MHEPRHKKIRFLSLPPVTFILPIKPIYYYVYLLYGCSSKVCSDFPAVNGIGKPLSQ